MCFSSNRFPVPNHNSFTREFLFVQNNNHKDIFRRLYWGDSIGWTTVLRRATIHHTESLPQKQIKRKSNWKVNSKKEDGLKVVEEIALIKNILVTVSFCFLPPVDNIWLLQRHDYKFCIKTWLRAIFIGRARVDKKRNMIYMYVLHSEI